MSPFNKLRGFENILARVLFWMLYVRYQCFVAILAWHTRSVETNFCWGSEYANLLHTQMNLKSICHRRLVLIFPNNTETALTPWLRIWFSLIFSRILTNFARVSPGYEGTNNMFYFLNEDTTSDLFLSIFLLFEMFACRSTKFKGTL